MALHQSLQKCGGAHGRDDEYGWCVYNHHKSHRYAGFCFFWLIPFSIFGLLWWLHSYRSLSVLRVCQYIPCCMHDLLWKKGGGRNTCHIVQEGLAKKSSRFVHKPHFQTMTYTLSAFCDPCVCIAKKVRSNSPLNCQLSMDTSTHNKRTDAQIKS